MGRWWHKNKPGKRTEKATSDGNYSVRTNLQDSAQLQLQENKILHDLRLYAGGSYRDSVPLLRKMLEMNYTPEHPELVYDLIIQIIDKLHYDRNTLEYAVRCLLLMVKEEDIQWLNQEHRELTTLKLMEVVTRNQNCDPLIRNSFLVLYKFNLPTDCGNGFYELLRLLIDVVLDRRCMEESLREVGVELIRRSAAQANPEQREEMARLGTVGALTKLIGLKMERGMRSERIENEWMALWSLMEGVPSSCHLFVEKCGGLHLMKDCLQGFESETVLIFNIIGVLSTIAMVAPLRSRILQYDGLLPKILRCEKLSFDVDCEVTQVLAFLASDGKDVWKEDDHNQVSRSGILCRIERKVDKWNVSHSRSRAYHSLAPLLDLLYVDHTPECQNWAAWALANRMIIKSVRNSNLLEDVGGIHVIETVIRKQGLETKISTNLKIISNIYYKVKKNDQEAAADVQCEPEGSGSPAVVHSEPLEQYPGDQTNHSYSSELSNNLGNHDPLDITVGEPPENLTGWNTLLLTPPISESINPVLISNTAASSPLPIEGSQTSCHCRTRTGKYSDEPDETTQTTYCNNTPTCHSIPAIQKHTHIKTLCCGSYVNGSVMQRCPHQHFHEGNVTIRVNFPAKHTVCQNNNVAPTCQPPLYPVITCSPGLHHQCQHCWCGHSNNNIPFCERSPSIKNNHNIVNQGSEICSGSTTLNLNSMSTQGGIAYSYHHPSNTDSRILPPSSFEPQLPPQSQQHAQTGPAEASSDPPNISSRNNSWTGDEDGILHLDVKQVEEVVPPGSDVYDTTTTPRGIAYIFNFLDFKTKENLISHPHRRDGSQYDLQNLQNLFSQMGYETHSSMNLTEDEFKNKLREIQINKRLQQVSSFIFVLMSHGIGRHTILTSDMEYVTTEYIQNQFLDGACPFLAGKPKLFFYTFCRGSDIPKRSQSLYWDSIREDVRDMIAIYSITEGFLAVRDTLKGTPFIRSICKVFAEHAANMSLSKLLRVFQNHYKPTPDIHILGFNKEFYFHPTKLPS